MIVCIAEKPSAGRDIAKILGANTQHSGYMEGNGYQVTWTFGHLCTLKEPHEYSPQWKRWSLFDLPIIPSQFGIRLIPNDGVERQFNTIKTLVQNAESVINCGDAGQEGELIQRWVLHKAGCKCPIQRLWVSSLTEEAIKEGFRNLKPQSDYQRLYEAGMARAIGDWLLGINATRLYTIKYGTNRQLLSIGRVQTPTLALIVQRYHDIHNFVPQAYWEIKTQYRDVTFNSEKGRYLKQEEAEKVMEGIKAFPLEIKSQDEKKGREKQPKLYDLTSLQVDCNRKFGYSADTTLKLIQTLYEKKWTTYPRVDTTFLSTDIHPKIPNIIKGIEGYDSEVLPLLDKPIPKDKRIFNNVKVTDHHAIIPTGVPARGVSGDEAKVYDMVTRRFIAVFYPECKTATTTVKADINGNPFKVTGKVILEPGWRILYQKETSKEEGLLPQFTVGESGPHEPGLLTKETQAPKNYSEATLLRAMEGAGKEVEDDELRDAMKENGIGRPSTRANIIETLFKRHYIAKEKKNIVATQTGIDLIGTIRNDLIKSAKLTGQWEKKLRQIDNGEYEPGKFIEEMKTMVNTISDEVKNDLRATRVATNVEEKKEDKPKKKRAPKAKIDLSTLVCPKCKTGSLIQGKAAYGCSNWQKGCKFVLPFDISGKKLTDNQVASLVQKGKTPLIKGFIQKGEKVDGTIQLNHEGVPELIVNE
jgi:DNA topoisomerase-3